MHSLGSVVALVKVQVSNSKRAIAKSAHEIASIIAVGTDVWFGCRSSSICMDSGVESIGLCCWSDVVVELDQQQGNKHGFNGLSHH